MSKSYTNTINRCKPNGNWKVIFTLYKNGYIGEGWIRPEIGKIDDIKYFVTISFWMNVVISNLVGSNFVSN